MELIRNTIPLCDLILDRTAVYEESTDTIVPDTFPDIARIICAVGNAVIKDESPQNDRVLVSGMVRAAVLYQPEGGEGICELDVPLSFAHIEEGKGVTADSTCFVRCQVIGVEARAVNSRKVSVTAKLCFETTAYGQRELSLTKDVDGGNMPLEILHTSYTVCVPERVQCRDFTVLDDLETQGLEGMHLVHMRCAMTPAESRAMHGKVVVKGDAMLCALLRAPDGGLRTWEQTVPFTQIFDFEGIEEGMKPEVRFAATSVDCELHEPGVMSIGIGARALLCSLCEQEIQTIRDLYQTTCPLQIQSETVRLTGLSPMGTLRGETVETVPLGMRAGRILDASAVCHGIQQEGEDSLRLNTAVRLLLQNEEGQTYAVTRILNCPMALPARMESGVLRDPVLQVSASLAGDDSANLRIAASGELYRKDALALQDVTSVEAGAPSPEDSMGPVTLVLRYIEDEESLWDVAKHYHTTMRAIRGANGLPEDTVTIRTQLLLIPICEQ